MSYFILSEEKNEKSVESFHIHGTDALITFIIPTVGSDSLCHTLQSLLDQTLPKWKAIVMFVGCFPTSSTLEQMLQDQRFLPLFIHTRIKGKKEVRNHGFPLVATPWIGFVEEEDRLHPRYVASLRTEQQITPHADVILFRRVQNSTILPSGNYFQWKEEQVGSSFAMKSTLIREGFVFGSSETEEDTLLQCMVGRNKIVVLSPFIMYYVQGTPPLPHPYPSLHRVHMYS